MITAQQVGAYKPALKNFQIARDAIGVPDSRILHVAQSLFHDIRPARTLDWRTVWVNRRGARTGAGATLIASADADLTVPDLATLVGIAREWVGEAAADDSGGHFYI